MKTTPNNTYNTAMTIVDFVFSLLVQIFSWIIFIARMEIGWGEFILGWLVSFLGDIGGLIIVVIIGISFIVKISITIVPYFGHDMFTINDFLCSIVGMKSDGFTISYDYVIKEVQNSCKKIATLLQIISVISSFISSCTSL